MENIVNEPAITTASAAKTRIARVLFVISAMGVPIIYFYVAAIALNVSTAVLPVQPAGFALFGMVTFA